MKTTKNYIWLLICYLIINLSTLIFIDKLILIHPFIVTFANLIIPVWFFINNLIAEIYGYKLARNALAIAIALQLLIVTLAFFSEDIMYVLTNTFSSGTKIATEIHRTIFAQLIAIFISGVTSSYVIKKLKSTLHGKHFALRGIGASAIGEIIFIIIYNLISFINYIPKTLIVKVLISSYMLNLMTNFGLLVILNIIVSLIAVIKNNNIYKNVELETIFNIITTNSRMTNKVIPEK